MSANEHMAPPMEDPSAKPLPTAPVMMVPPLPAVPAPTAGAPAAAPFAAQRSSRPPLNKFMLGAVALRGLQFLFSLIAWTVMASASQGDFDFSDVKSFKFLLAVNIITTVWVAVAGGLTLFELLQPDQVPELVHTVLASLDWVLSYLLFGCSCAAAASITQNTVFCDAYDHACSKASTAAAFSFFTFFIILPTALLSTRVVLEKFGHLIPSIAPTKKQASQV